MALIYNLLFTSLLIAATPSSTACPVSCNCTKSNLKVWVSCQGEEITAIPSKLPENTTTVDLKDPVKCDCGFYRYWKILKGKRIAIQGKCSELSAGLSGSSFKDLTEESFACAESTGSEKSFSPSAESSTAAVNVLPSSSVISEKNLPVTSKHVGDGASKSSQNVPVVLSSEAVLLVKSSKSVSTVTSFQAVPVVTSSQAVPVLTSYQAVPVVTSSKVVLAVTSSQVVPVVTSTQAAPVVKSSKVVPAVTSSQVVPVVTSPQAGPVVKSSKVVPAVTSFQPDGLSLSPSRSLAKAAVATTSDTPRIREISTSTVVELAVNSSIRSGSSSSVITVPPSRSAGVDVKGTSAADVSPTAGDIVNASATATAPPTMKESPVITAFNESETVPLNTMVQVKCVATGNPPPKVYLTFNNQPAEDVDGVTVTSSDSETQIMFKAVRNSTIYCEATNELGREKRKITVSVEQTGAKYLLLQVKLTEETFNENLNNKVSEEFKNLAKRITSQVRSLLSSVSGFLGASVVRFWPGSVKADILIKTYQDNDDSVEKTLKAELDKAKLGTIPVDRYLYTFKLSQACPSVFENVTWNDTAHGDSDVQFCPRGAQGFARRNCSNGNWYYPDHTNCKSSEYTRLKDQINQSVSGNNNKDDIDKNILTGLQNLLNLTTPNEDYAILAGDLATCTEILQMVVDYTTRRKEDNVRTTDEVKLMIKVASNILHEHNEQQFIVGQKLLQMASKFILALEKYGLQSARVASLGADTNENLAIFITENVVMGVGVADPETIPTDVIFPNYNWPKLEQLKQQWNATTFVVLGTQMIKDLELLAGKDGVRIAAFLYRTLTRILSVESAYSDQGLAFELNSAVISASIDPKPTKKLIDDPIIIASSHLQEVEDEHKPICAFWDFNMNAPHGGWSEEGCNTTNYNTMRTTCQCDHMTNFAILRRKPYPPVVAMSTSSTSDFMHCLYIACWIIIAFAAVTFLILLILCPWLKPDRTWVMHMCVCASIIVTFVLVILGLVSYNNLGLCNLFSTLVHYFYLCAFSWILTESVYMRTWDTIKGAQKKYWIGYFLLGWGLPGIVVLIAWLINKLVNFESFMSCWMSIHNPLVWTFFAPAIIFFLITCIIFVRVWRAVTGLPRQALKTYYHNTRFRVQIRYCIILMLMFIITWLVGVLLLTYYTKALLCILFIICCIITGFMLLLFYVIMDRQVRDAFKSCCCYCRRGRRGSYWVAGEKQKPQEDVEELEYEYRQQQERQQERQRLVSEGVEQQEQQPPDIELNDVDKSPEQEEPLLREEARPVFMYEGAPPLESSTESFDPLYDRVRPSQSVTVEVRPGLPREDEGPKPEPVYAQVVKPKRLRHPESDSDDDDDLLTPEEREARGIRGLTREQVIRMAKKSDASKKVLKVYESPSGSKEQLGGPVYLLNQQELDEELKQFRSFFAHGKTPPSSEPTTSIPKPEDGSSTPSGSFKRETSTEVHQSYHRVESTSSSVSKRTLSGESQKSITSVSRKEETKVEKKVVSSARPVEETAIDSSLHEVDRTDDADDDSPTKPTAVSDDDSDLRASLFKYFTSTHHKEEEDDDWSELLEALKE